MNFKKWYDMTWPDTVGKHDIVNIACRSAASYGWDAGVKAERERVLEILEGIHNLHMVSSNCKTYHQLLNEAIERIESLRG